MTPTDINRRVDRQGELSEIEQFIAEKGVRRCKPAFVALISVNVPDEKRRLAELTIKPSLSIVELERFGGRACNDGR